MQHPPSPSHPAIRHFHNTALGVVLALFGLALTTVCSQAQTVNVWLTLHDLSKELEPQAPATFSPGNSGGNPVVVDEARSYQEIEGFGASFTDSAAWLLNEVATPAARTNAMNDLFTRNGAGIGLGFVRNPMGASDLARTHYSYDDLPAGQTDVNLTNFSIAHDQADIIPLMLTALQLNPQLKVMANPWSPPGWMKSSGSMIGGSLLPSMYSPFARYFVKYIQACAAAGIPVHYISLENEPLYVPGDYPGMSMDAATQTTILRDFVLPALRSNSLSTRVLVYDHNFDRPDYPQTVLGDATLAASSQVAGIAWHGYGGTPGVMLTLGNQYPGKGQYMTEHSGGGWVGDQVRQDFTEIIHVLRCGGKAYVKWSLAQDQNDGPNLGGCGTCTGIVRVQNPGGSITYGTEFYTLGHFSKFILPGAYRVYSGNANGIVTAAFRNLDGSKALVAFNDTSASKTFQVWWGTVSFSYTLPSYAGATFTWSGAQPGTNTTSAANPIQAASFHSQSGIQTEWTSDPTGGFDLGYCDNGDYAVYRNVSFSGATNVSLRAASFGAGSVEFRLDSPAGTLLGSVPMPNTGDWQTFTNVNAPVAGASGVHDLYLVVRGSSGVGNLLSFLFGTGLPAPWSTADIGPVGATGSASGNSGMFEVTGSGADIESTADEFRYVYQNSTGDGSLIARVTAQDNSNPWAKAGIMMRETTDADSRNAAVLVTPGNGVTFQRRTSKGAATTVTVVAGLAAPLWLKLKRAGNSFSGYWSHDGVVWTQVGTSQTISMPSAATAGLAVTSHADGTLCSGRMDNVSLNHPPVLSGIPNQSTLAGLTLSVTNSATDADVPAQTLTYSLALAPAGASIDGNTGLFSWRPAIAQSPGAHSVAVVVSDSGIPSLSATQTFSVAIATPGRPSMTSPAPGESGFGFQISGDYGPDYIIQTSTNLLDWPTAELVNSPALPFHWTDTNSDPAPQRFYRVLLGP
ncbi:MAG: carbohydrate-binding protein [Verrucomicrobiota bacterium]